MAKPVIGMQLHSVRNIAEIDLLDTLEKVADLGYEAVEFSGYYHTPAEQLKTKLDELGFKLVSSHIPLSYDKPVKMEKDLNREIAYAQKLGLNYLIVPWSPLPAKPDIHDVKLLADLFLARGQQVKAAGGQLRFGYHNHEFDFKQVEGRSVLDHLAELVPQELLVFELDLGWIYLAGGNPAAELRKLAGRVPLLHFKDFTTGRMDAEVGEGKVPFDEVLDIAEECGVEAFFVEQEQYSSDSLESARISMDFFRRSGFG
ncbi:sugar phosphate isomerase/epimerase family protein [Paenibacillus sp. GCM10023252]|uniref:sugar phosphate isomerase/epimerase family protein n=1 Tax=Paenibacillus sp. GCM10023252 TaxID=3252649 RepID=UPI003620567B